MSILFFISENPCVSFFMTYILFVFIFKIINRVLRTIKVCFRGWPPIHLDADGDFFLGYKNDRN